jgi:dihydrolipoamide dehydrogenase
VLPANEKLKASKRAVRAAEVMVAVGKRPAIRKLGLDALGMKFDKRGALMLTAYLQTSIPTIYMAGDAAGQMLFTHVAHYQGDIAGQNAVRGNKLKSDLAVVPRATFVHPEVGSVGITEAAAKKQGLSVKTGLAPMAGLGRALASGDHEGLVKLVVNKKTGHIIGGGVVGQCAGELIHEIALAIYAKVPYNKIANMIHAYPTWSEAVGVAAYMVDNA